MRREQSSETAEGETKYLKILIRLLIEEQITDEKLTTDKAVLMLNSMGLMPMEIAQIIGLSNGATRVALHRSRMKNKRTRNEK